MRWLVTGVRDARLMENWPDSRSSPPDEVPSVATPVLARRIAACLDALKTGTVAALENGTHVS